MVVIIPDTATTRSQEKKVADRNWSSADHTALFGERRRVFIVYSEPAVRETTIASELLAAMCTQVDGTVEDLPDETIRQMTRGMYPCQVLRTDLVTDRRIRAREYDAYIEEVFAGDETDFTYRTLYTSGRSAMRFVNELGQHLGRDAGITAHPKQPMVIFECQPGERIVWVVIADEPIPGEPNMG